VWVGGGWPALFSIVQVGPQPSAHRQGQGDEPAVQMQPPVADVGKQQPTELARGQRVESDQGCQRCPGGSAELYTSANASRSIARGAGLANRGAWIRAVGLQNASFRPLSTLKMERSPCRVLARPRAGR
jgi:hypothetical protein